MRIQKPQRREKALAILVNWSIKKVSSDFHSCFADKEVNSNPYPEGPRHVGYRQRNTGDEKDAGVGQCQQEAGKSLFTPKGASSG